MARVALKTVRVTGIPLQTETDEFLRFATRLSGSAVRGTFQSSRPPHSQLKTTFAIQNENQIGTIMFRSEKEKEEALKDRNSGWHLDDNFHGITVLSSPIEADLDVCALHGLNGNAIQSWTSKENEVLWLRDLLPTTKPFEKARIMTFGYSSQLCDRANESRMSEWVHHLLESVNSVRCSAKEKQRPILLICHSMGGIVARQAMVRLNQYGDRPEYQGIPLSCCGLLFLSTPHSGSTEADWIDYLRSFSKLWGVRSEVVNILKSFNPQTAEGQEDFANLKSKPPFETFYETHGTKIGTFHRLIVTRQSASLDGVIAKPLRGTDHNTICKYTNKFGVFEIVAEKLRELKRRIEDKKTCSSYPSEKVYSAPPNALNIYNPQDKKFFIGQGLNKRNNFKGRESELELLHQLVNSHGEGDPKSVLISGIGGMGKTATLLEFAQQQRNKRDVFFVHARNGDFSSLHSAYYHIARLVGPDYLLRDHIGRDIQGIWSNESQEDKVERLKIWLGELENDQTLLLLDDFDGLRSTELRESALPGEAKNVLLTTRNPVFRGGNTSSVHPLHMPAMPSVDIIAIMESVRDTESPEYSRDADLYDEDTLISVAGAVSGHPLAATIAMKYIVRVGSLVGETSAGRDFVAMFESPDLKSRRHFLDYRPDDTPSILETFLISKNRLADPQGPTWTLMEFLSMIETGDPEVNYQDFFFSNTSDIDPTEYLDHELLQTGKYEMLGLFGEIQSVSFGERIQTSRPFHFSPLWLECSRHIMEAEGRVRVITQVLKRCFTVLREAANRDVDITQETFRKFIPHLRHCLRVCKSFKIRASHLNLSPQIIVFIESGDRKLVSIDSAIRAFRVEQVLR